MAILAHGETCSRSILVFTSQGLKLEQYEKSSLDAGSNLQPSDVPIQSRALCLSAIEAAYPLPFISFSDLSHHSLLLIVM